MTVIAKGTFDIDLQPQPLHHTDASPLLARMSLDKQFYGDLQGTSTGEMLSARTATEGSAGYVVIEEVHGSLAGRSGSFVLQHSGTMQRGEATLSLSVVPDSGTGALEGLAGTMQIDNLDGQHHYTFTYTL